MIILPPIRFLLFIVLAQASNLLCMDRLSSLSSPAGSPAAAAASSLAAQPTSLSSAAQAQSLPIENALIKALYTHGTLICFPHHVDEKIAQALQMLSSCIALPDLTKTQPTLEDFAAATDIAHWLQSHYNELPTLTKPEQDKSPIPSTPKQPKQDKIVTLTTPEQLAAAYKQHNTVAFKGITQELSSSETAALAAQAASSSEPLPQDALASNSNRAVLATQAAASPETRRTTSVLSESGVAPGAIQTNTAPESSSLTTPKSNHYREIYQSKLAAELRSSIPSSAFFGKNQPTDTAIDAIQFVCSDRMLCFLLRELLITAAHPAPEDDLKRYSQTISKCGLYGIPVIFQRYRNYEKSALQERLFNLIEHYSYYETIDIIQLLEITHEWRRYDLFQAALQYFMVHLNTMTLSGDAPIPAISVSSHERASLTGEAILGNFAQHFPYYYYDTLVHYPDCAPFLLKCLYMKARAIPLSNTIEWDHIQDAIRSSLLAMPDAVKTMPTIAALFDGDSAQEKHFRTLLTKAIIARYPLCCHQSNYIFSPEGNNRFFMNGDILTIIAIKDNLISVVTLNLTTGQRQFKNNTSWKTFSLSKQELSAIENKKVDGFDTSNKAKATLSSPSKNLELAEQNIHFDKPLTKGIITTYCSKDSSTQVICSRQSFHNLTLVKVVTIKEGPLSECFILLPFAITHCYPLHEKAFLIADSKGMYIIDEHGKTMRKLDAIAQLPAPADAAQLSMNQREMTVTRAASSPATQRDEQTNAPTESAEYINISVKNDYIYALLRDGTIKLWRLNQVVDEHYNQLISTAHTIEPTVIKCFLTEKHTWYSIKIIIPLSNSKIAVIYDDIHSDERNTIGLFSAIDGSFIQLISLSDRSIFEPPYEQYAQPEKRFEHIESINEHCLAFADDNDTLYIYNTLTNKVVHVKSYKTGNMKGKIVRLLSMHGFLYTLTDPFQGNIQIDGQFIKEGASIARICSLLKALTQRKAQVALIAKRPQLKQQAIDLLPDDSCQQCIQHTPLRNTSKETLKSIHFVSASANGLHALDAQELDCFVGEFQSNDVSTTSGSTILGQHTIIGGLVYDCDNIHLYEEKKYDGDSDKEITLSQEPFHITVIDNNHIAFCSQQCVKLMRWLYFRVDQKGTITGQFKWPRSIIGMACIKGVQLDTVAPEDSHLLIVDESGAYLVSLDGTIKHTFRSVKDAQRAAKDTFGAIKNKASARASRTDITAINPENDADTKFENPVAKMAFDHNLLILAYADKTMKMWNLTQCQEIGHIQPTSNSAVQDSSHLPVTALCVLNPFSIFITYANNVARIYDVKTLSFIEFALLIGETQPVCIHEIRKDLIAIGCTNGDVHIFDTVKKAIARTVPSKGRCYPIKMLMDQGLLKIIYSDGTGEDWCMPELQ